MLHILFIKAQLKGESQSMMHAVCSARGVDGAHKSPDGPRLLYSVFYSAAVSPEGKWTVECPDIPSVICPVPDLEVLPLEELLEYTLRNTAVICFKRCGCFPDCNLR